MKRTCHICQKPLKHTKVYTGYIHARMFTWMHKDGSKCCDLCLKPLQLLEIGEKKFPVWVHEGEQLRECKAIRLSYNFAKTIMRRLPDLQRHLRYEMVGDHVRRFRETR